MEIHCPKCSNSFIENIDTDNGYSYKWEKDGRISYGWSSKCPSCNTWLLVEDGVRRAIEWDAIASDKVGSVHGGITRR